MTTSWQKFRSRASSVISKVRPVTAMAERAANIAVHLRNGITPLGAVGILSAAVNGLDQAMRRGDDVASPAPSRGVCCSRATMAAALIAAGWQVKEHREASSTLIRESSWINVGDGGHASAGSDAELEVLGAALDAFLPPAVHLAREHGMYVDLPVQLKHFDTEHGRTIAELTSMHLGDGTRCILLHGRPGTGKTTLAREIVDRLALGRAVFLAGHLFADTPHWTALAMLRPAIVVVDDIDKIQNFSNGDIEMLRQAARVVILTANNAERDDVLDGSLVRPERVDEVFIIESAPYPREPPFDQLTDEEWKEASTWPVAYSNELARRLTLRGRAGMRFEDLRDRIRRKVRSGEVLV